MRFGSLFAGIGGFDLGLERAGMECRWQVEIDPYARRVLSKHWPNVPKYGDIREVNWSEVEPVDLICGGFPCQDISNAGKREGIEGERSGLWAEYVRAIRALRPRYVLVENVAALLGRGIERVLGDLAASRYDAEWDCIPAASVGAPHIRDRVFIVGHRDGAHSNGGWVFLPGRGPDAGAPGADEGTREERQRVRPDVAAVGSAVSDADSDGAPHARPDERVGRIRVAPNARREGRGGRARAGGSQWAVEPAVGRVADGVPARLDRLRGLGNAVVPQVAEFLGRAILASAASNQLPKDGGRD